MPSRVEIAEAMDIPLDELDSLLRQALTTSSLDAPVNGRRVAVSWEISLPTPRWMNPSTSLSNGFTTSELGRWLSHLSEQEQHVLRLRFGLEGNERHTLAEIGRLMDVSRERVRQVELKALRKLRNLTLTRRLPSGI